MLRQACAALLASQFAAGSAACAGAAAPVVGTEAGANEATATPTTPPATAFAAPAAPATAPDHTCLRALDGGAVAYRSALPAGGMRTPIEVTGPIGGVSLVARGRRAAVMDCVLASALSRAREIFQDLGITALAFSAAFDHRTRRGSTEASGHAYGLAIDVHVIRGSFGEYDVSQSFERAVGVWRGLRKGEGALDACVGQPTTKEGRLLRQLACRLKLDPAFRVVVTPDDDADHQDHLHFEARAGFFPPAPGTPPLAPPPPPAPPPAPQKKLDATPSSTQRLTMKRKRSTKRKQKQATKQVTPKNKSPAKM